jgi:hypothetical protein
MTVLTTAQAIALTGVEIHDHLDRELSIPLLTGMQRQGDVLVRPHPNRKPATSLVPAVGVPIVRGENGGNTHLLLTESGTVTWDWLPASGTDLTLGVLTVADGSAALLAHPEHGYMRIGAGNYTIGRQREQADEIRRVED